MKILLYLVLWILLGLCMLYRQSYLTGYWMTIEFGEEKGKQYLDRVNSARDMLCDNLTLPYYLFDVICMLGWPMVMITEHRIEKRIAEQMRKEIQ